VENGVFYHPDMSFSFRVPNGWNLQNTARQVTLSPENGKAVIILQAEDTNQNLQNYTETMMKKFTSPQVMDQGFRTINGLRGYQTLLNAVTGEEETDNGTRNTYVDIDISCIRKGQTVFTFFSAAAPSDFDTYERSIDNTVKSFNTLRSSRHLNRKPLRLYIKTAPRAETLDTYLIKQRVPAKLRKKVALINGMTLGQRLTPYQRVKIVK